MHTETYYAIRIGDPRRHKPYFWAGEDGNVPILFPTRSAAEDEKKTFESETCVRVVRVKLRAG